MSWAAGLRATMSTEDKVRDAASAQTLKAEHEALKGEIEAREDSFSAVLDLGEAMVQTGHYAAPVNFRKCLGMKRNHLFMKFLFNFFLNLNPF